MRTGAGTHRTNLRIAIDAPVRRLDDVRLAPGTGHRAPGTGHRAWGTEIEWHSVLNRPPLRVPIEFTPGPQATPA